MEPTSGRTILVVMAMTLLALAAPARTEPRVLDLSIRNRALPKDQQVVRVRQGDDVTLRWTTDRRMTIHLHGYDLEQTLAPGPPVSMRFTARAAGRFPIEIHAHGQDKEQVLGYLEVHPR
jgi:hypothetical protein